MKIKDYLQTGYYSTSTTLGNLEKLADATNESSLMQEPTMIQGGKVTPLSTQGTKLTAKGMVQNLWTKFTNIFKPKN